VRVRDSVALNMAPSSTIWAIAEEVGRTGLKWRLIRHFCAVLIVAGGQLGCGAGQTSAPAPTSPSWPAAVSPASLTLPKNGSTGVDPWVTLTWSSVSGASSYSVQVGSTQGGSNIFSSGSLTSTSVFVPGLQENTTYYVRVFTTLNSVTNYTDSSFTTGYGIAHLTNPLNGVTGVDPFGAFTWTPIQNAQFYYLYVGTTSGGTDIMSTEFPVGTTSTVVPGMIGGQTYYAKMWTEQNGVWSAAPVNSFQTAPQPLPSSASTFRTNVQSQTASVRMMTQGMTNTPTAGTPLAQQVVLDGHTTAFCTDYARTLLKILTGQSISARLRDVLFDGANFETHEMVEYYDPFLTQWIVTDPTFGATYWNASTSTGLSVAQISAEVVAKDWSAIPIVYVTSYGNAVFTSYYMDPILLYLNPLPLGVITTHGTPPNSPVPYMTPVTSIGQANHFVFGFANTTDTATVADPVQGTLTISPSNGTLFSSDTLLNAGWLITSSPSGLTVYTINRYLF
jgi:hypothetical protein